MSKRGTKVMYCCNFVYVSSENPDANRGDCFNKFSRPATSLTKVSLHINNMFDIVSDR